MSPSSDIKSRCRKNNPTDQKNNKHGKEEKETKTKQEGGVRTALRKS